MKRLRFLPFFFILISTDLIGGQSRTGLIGETKDDVLAQLGKPTNILGSSQRAILAYPQGSITLVNEKVDSFTGNFNYTAPIKEVPIPEVTSPKAPTRTLTQSTENAETPYPKFSWNIDLKKALEKAAHYDLPILALFTGPDWCPPCMQMENEVLSDPRFKEFVQQRFIPLKIALYRNSYQNPTEKAQYKELSSRYQNRGVPAFYVLDKEGTRLSKPDIFKQYKGVNDRTELIIAAIEQADNSTGFPIAPIKLVAGLGALLVIVKFLKK